jgi:hypothetical protein
MAVCGFQLLSGYGNEVGFVKGKGVERLLRMRGLL